MHTRLLPLLVVASISLAITSSIAKPVAPNHPLIGTWRITLNLPTGRCDEIHSIRPDGTSRVTSREEIAESEYEISDEPNEKGFYTWIDTITKGNGKPDCLGQVTPVGDVATNYVVFHPSGNMFVLCIEQSLDRCIGPFVRQKDGDA